MKKSTIINEYQWIDKATRFLDSKFRIPGTSFRFGFDPLIGLVPGLGDIATFFASSMLVLAMARHGASGKVIALMTINILIDAVFGGIPVIGNIFDFFFKANERNIKLLKRHHLEGKYQGNAKGVLIVTALILLILFIVIVFLIWKLLAYSFDFFSNL